MAKKTSATRGKTKTAKKTKATSKTKPAAVKAAPKNRNLNLKGTFSRLSVRRRQSAKKTGSSSSVNTLHLVSVLVFGALAAAAVFLMRSVQYPISVGYLGRDELASQSTAVFTGAWQPVFDLDIRWALVALLVLSAVVPLMYLTRLKGRYSQWTKDKVITLRWIDMGVTLGIMTALVALLSGINDLATLKIVAGLMLVTAALGWIAEKQNTGVSKQPALGAFRVSVLSGLLPWLLIAFYAVSTLIFGMIRAPWYVYALYAVVLGGALLLCLNQSRYLKRFKQWSDYLVVERNYLVLNLAVKALFAIVLIVGLQR